MAKRLYDELPVFATGVQRLEDRFGKRMRGDDYNELPRISEWRCNLTGLSQQNNLYFVAHGHEIYVYVPQFPTQCITKEPALIVPSQQLPPGRRGYMDPSMPHAINNLLVQFLGNEEVVAAVRDDGDVTVVLVRHIARAIEERAQPGNSLNLVANDVRPFYQNNVGDSAWGIAIHSQARILAVSANSHEIRVFKFGLYSAEDSTAINHESGAEREADVNIRILNGISNIPCISFCNTGHDPHGRWLLSTDISGNCQAIDILDTDNEFQKTQMFKFGEERDFTGEFDLVHAGWTIMFLDTRSFKVESHFTAAVGSAGLESDGAKAALSRSWDLSETVNNPNMKNMYWGTKFSGTDRSLHIQRGRSLAPFDNELDVLISENDGQRTEDSELEVSQDEENELSSAVGSYIVDEVEAYIDSEDEDEIEMMADFVNRRETVHRVHFIHEGPLCDDLPCPILHTSAKNVFLLQPSNQKSNLGPFSPPVVGFETPLRQQIPLEFGALHRIDRLNMHAYIPSIGVVILASQKGRILVLSLTKIPGNSGVYPQALHMYQNSNQTKYAMRAEHILPFPDQEDTLARSIYPLHGIAVGPIQGTARLPDGRKRWRLMVMYQNYTILSYEIGRHEGALAVDAETVLV
ncbi:Hypothetical protein R9X50_00381400 [Acrodontium crateriforme]|uniref:Uncharacterized protein n=1 Tax=Acrodontium crateriforme TaxID=150365 RepID=A0AAQ3M4Z2_9PEZI|nr:Hypothetical protein R9X50_00381400 [Acrodontium crateriforme]